jgi:hypothetical protein
VTLKSRNRLYFACTGANTKSFDSIDANLIDDPPQSFPPPFLVIPGTRDAKQANQIQGLDHSGAQIRFVGVLMLTTIALALHQRPRPHIGCWSKM